VPQQFNMIFSLYNIMLLEKKFQFSFWANFCINFTCLLQLKWMLARSLP